MRRRLQHRPRHRPKRRPPPSETRHPMNLSSWSIKNPIPAAMLFVLLTLGGLFAFKAMKVQNFPDRDLPVVIVTAALPGASPGQLENDVARKIENSIATLQGLKHVTSTLTDGSATIAAQVVVGK